MQAQPQKATSYDLAVVGAGVIGLSCAWRASQAGMSVVVLERDEPGGGASGVAAGMLAPVTEADFGAEALLRLNIEARALWRVFAAELEQAAGQPIGYHESGALVVAADRDDAEELRRLHDFQRGLGLSSQWLGPRAARGLEPGLSPRIAGAIEAPDEGHVNPAAVVSALAAALTESGAEIRCAADVAGFDCAGARVRGVGLAGGETVRAERVLVAAGAWSAQGGIAKAGGLPAVRPVKGQLLELRTRLRVPAPAQRLIRTPRCYVVSRPADGERTTVVVGATMEEQGFDTAVTASGVHQLLEAAYEVLPDTAELELVRARAGLRPFTADGRPAVGAAALDGLFFATGHGRNGVLQAPLAARQALALLGAEPSHELVRAGAA